MASFLIAVANQHTLPDETNDADPPTKQVGLNPSLCRVVHYSNLHQKILHVLIQVMLLTSICVILLAPLPGLLVKFVGIRTLELDDHSSTDTNTRSKGSKCDLIWEQLNEMVTSKRDMKIQFGRRGMKEIATEIETVT